MEPARPTWSSTPQPPAEGLRLGATPPSPEVSPYLTTRPGQDLPLSRTVIPATPRRGDGLRGPLRLRLASASRPGARCPGVQTTQPRTRADSGARQAPHAA